MTTAQTRPMAGSTPGRQRPGTAVFLTGFLTGFLAGKHARNEIMCHHDPVCPSAYAPDHEAARLVASHPEQGWGLLCNGVIVFDDTGELLPDGRSVPAHPALLVRAA